MGCRGFLSGGLFRQGNRRNFAETFFSFQRKNLKGNNWRAKSFRHFLTLFHTFSYFSTLPKGFFVLLKLRPKKGNKKKKEAKPFCTLVVARLSSSNLSTVWEEKRTQTQTFWSGYLRAGWGSSTWRGGGQKVRYVPRNQGNQTYLAGYPGILPGYPGGARKVWKKNLCWFFGPIQKTLNGGCKTYFCGGGGCRSYCKLLPLNRPNLKKLSVEGVD